MTSPVMALLVALLGGTWGAGLIWLLLRRQTAAALALQRCLHDLQGQHWALQQQLGRLQAAPTPTPVESAGGVGLERLYERAIRMARQGTAAEALASACGLSRAEAELVVRFHAGSDARPMSAGERT